MAAAGAAAGPAGAAAGPMAAVGAAACPAGAAAGPMAAVGAAAGPAGAAGPPGARQLAPRVRRRGARRARRPVPAGSTGPAGARTRGGRLTFAAVAAGMALAVGGGFTLLAGLGTPGHPGAGASPGARAPGSGRPGPAAPGATPGSGAPLPAAPGAASARAMPHRPPAPPARRPAPPRPPRGPAPWHEVTGVGCAHGHGDGVVLHSAPAGPGWQAAGGGWTGDGCNGSTAWTMDSSGHPDPSMVTWTFTPSGVSWCTVAVFIPTQNALGVSQYSVFTGPPAPGQAVAAVQVTQAGEAGQWLTLGTFRVAAPRLEVTATPVPGPSGPGHHGAIAASAASARCS
jgi:hypothetical protein